MTCPDPRVLHFLVQLSEPYERERFGKLEPTVRNISLDVITTTAARAIELSLALHPDASVHHVQRHGSTCILLDPQIVKELVTEPA